MSDADHSPAVSRSAGSEIERDSSAGRCAYCGAQLHAMFYFCLSCATPWREYTTAVMPASPPVLGEGEMIRMKAPAVAPLFWTYVAVLVGSWVVARLLFQEDRPDLQLILQDTVLFVTTCVLAVIYRRTLVAQLRRFGFTHPAAWIGIVALVPLLMANYAYHGFIMELWPGEPQDFLADLREAGVSEAFLIISICIFPAIAEELAFRGMIQHWLATAIKPFRALVLASFLFTAMHFSIVSFPYLFAVGMLLGWTKWRTGSLYPAMLIHFLHNWAVIALLEPAW